MQKRANIYQVNNDEEVEYNVMKNSRINVNDGKCY